MSWTDIEKNLAGRLAGMFSRAKTVEQAVVAEITDVEKAIVGDVKSAFDQARTDALAANDEVNRLKDELQTALAHARDLHQIAVNSALAAAAQAEADLAKFKAMAAAHSADMATQASQITTPQQ